MSIVITGTGIYTPPHTVTNQQLVTVFNEYVESYNYAHRQEIFASEMERLEYSDADFIQKASGIKKRHFIDKSGILEPTIMCPRIPERADGVLSLQAEISVEAANQALRQANKSASEIDVVIAACSNFQRPYPAIAVEVQQYLGVKGFAFDLNVACSSATFAIQVAHDLIKSGSARSVLIVNPEICSGHLNFRDRDSHFIFGDACAATIVEDKQYAKTSSVFEIMGIRLLTEFSNNVRNNGGFLNRTWPQARDRHDKLFTQQGRKVFKEIPSIVCDLIYQTLKEKKLEPEGVRRFWLHQANLNMNQLIIKKLLGTDVEKDRAPIILDEYGNTSSAGVIIAFHFHSADLKPGDLGVLSSFGAGYSAGCVLLRKQKL
jgi:beta-ketodecanoyl-[acyl-carrier-protein] synthase